jgi:uncharacterized membrane protein YdjX (TVP38/TMEM64 family)
LTKSIDPDYEFETGYNFNGFMTVFSLLFPVIGDGGVLTLNRFARNPKFRAIDDAVADEGWKIVGLIRLSPVFPFIPMNFVFGLTRIPFWQFFFATWIGILPICILFVYLGTLLGDIAALGTQPIAAGKTKWVVSAIGIGTTLVVTLFITRIARKALASRIPDEE